MIEVVAWSTGNVGAHAVSGIRSHPGLELTGVFTSTPAKAGREVAELCGLEEPTGLTATDDADALLATGPDCVCHTAMADTRLPEALADLQGFLEAGIDVVTSSPVFLQYPEGMDPSMWQPVRDAARAGGASLFASGIDPGFANDWLPLSVFDVMGFGQPLDADPPMLLQPGVLTVAWGSVVRQLAAGLDVELDEVRQEHERLPAPETFDISSGTVPEGTAAALRFRVEGLVDDRPVAVLEHVTRLRDDLAPDWPQPAGQGCYRVEVTGSPTYTVDLQLLGEDGDHNTAGLTATAMRIVNAIPAVVAADPGLVTALDLPLVTGRGRVATGG